MEAISIKLQLYIGGVAVAAATLFSYQIRADAPHIDWGEFAFFLALLIIAELRPVLMERFALSVNFVILIVAMINLPPAAVTLAAALGVFGSLADRETRPSRFIFNSFQLAFSAGISAEIYALVAGVSRFETDRIWVMAIGVLLATAVTFILNSTAVSAAIALDQGVGFVEVWGSNFQWMAVSNLGFGVFGLVLASLYEALGVLGLPLLLVPLLVARSVFRAYQEVEDAYEDTIRAFVKAIEAKDTYTEGHSQRVTEYAVWIAERVGLHGEELDVFKYGALLHDVGKLAIRRSTLTKPGKLEDFEFDEIKEHPVLGARIVKEIEFLSPALDGVLYHHERLDGSGYPAGLAGDLVPLHARMMAVADTFDAMTSTRAYRGAKSMEEALAELRRCSGTQFDPKMVEIFLQAIQEEDRYKAVTERIARDAWLARTPA